MTRYKGQRIGAYADRWKIPPADPVARALADARRKDGRTQAELVKDLGIKLSTLAHYETGRRPVPWHLWARLTEELPQLLELEAQPDWPSRGWHSVVKILADDRSL